MNAVVQYQPAVDHYGNRSLTAADVRAQVNLMHDVMDEVMQKDTHFGVIPGTQKPTLYKAGAEKIMSTFRLAADPEVEDLGRDGEIHYRVKVRILSASGAFLGAGIGECSSQEDKYAWRAAVCPEEYEATPENRRRIKYAKYQGKVEQKKQVRTSPADVGNTILKMAKKRGLIDGVLTVTAASDLFSQDIEDLPPEIVAEIIEKQDRTASRPGTPQSGVWETLSKAQQEKIEKVAATVRDIMENDDTDGAWDHIQKQGFDADNKVALWGKLSSKIRSALTEHSKSLPKQETTTDHADDAPAAFERK